MAGKFLTKKRVVGAILITIAGNVLVKSWDHVALKLFPEERLALRSADDALMSGAEAGRGASRPKFLPSVPPSEEFQFNAWARANGYDSRTIDDLIFQITRARGFRLPDPIVVSRTRVGWGDAPNRTEESRDLMKSLDIDPDSTHGHAILGFCRRAETRQATEETLADVVLLAEATSDGHFRSWIVHHAVEDAINRALGTLDVYYSFSVQINTKTVPPQIEVSFPCGFQAAARLEP